MFSIQEIRFLSSELGRFTNKIEKRLSDEALHEDQRNVLQKRLITTESIRRKLEYEKRLRNKNAKKTPKVLIIEDVESVRSMEQELLKVIGFESTDTAING